MKDWQKRPQDEAHDLHDKITKLEARLVGETDKTRSRFMANQLAAMYGYEGALLARMAYDDVQTDIENPEAAKSLADAFHEAERLANNHRVVKSADADRVAEAIKCFSGFMDAVWPVVANGGRHG